MCFFFVNVLEIFIEVNIFEEKLTCLRCEIRIEIDKIVYMFILWDIFKK